MWRPCIEESEVNFVEESKRWQQARIGDRYACIYQYQTILDIICWTQIIGCAFMDFKSYYWDPSWKNLNHIVDKWFSHDWQQGAALGLHCDRWEKIPASDDLQNHNQPSRYEGRAIMNAFEYGRYGTETASTEAAGDMVRRSHKCIVCYFLIPLFLDFTLYLAPPR